MPVDLSLNFVTGETDRLEEDWKFYISAAPH